MNHDTQEPKYKIVSMKRVERLEKFARWALEVAEANHFDKSLALNRIADRAREALK